MLITSFVAASGRVHAESANLRVSPAVQNLVAQQSQTTISYTVSVTNAAETPVIVALGANNFNALGTNGQLIFTNNTAADADHGLAKRMTFVADTFTLAAGESKLITITLNDLTTLKAGGHYGAVIFKTRPFTAAPISGRQVTLNQSVASLVFLTTNGTGKYGLELQPVNSPAAVFKLPASYNLVFKNTGNIQTAPRGYMVVTDPFKRAVARATINPDSGLVLPQTSRLLQTSSVSTSRAFWPGLYTVHTYYKYDNASTYRQQTSRFLFVNLLFTGPIIMAVIAAIYALTRFKKQLLHRIKNLGLKRRSVHR